MTEPVTPEAAEAVEVSAAVVADPPSDSLSALQRRMEEQARPFIELQRRLENQVRPLDELQRRFEEQARPFIELQRRLDDQMRPLIELRRRFEEQARPVAELQRTLQDMASPTAELQRQFEEKLRPLTDLKRRVEEEIRPYAAELRHGLQEHARRLLEQQTSVVEDAVPSEDDVEASPESPADQAEQIDRPPHEPNGKDPR